MLRPHRSKIGQHTSLTASFTDGFAVGAGSADARQDALRFAIALRIGEGACGIALT
jgi:hypothetical protein